MENLIKMDDLGVPLFLETPIMLPCQYNSRFPRDAPKPNLAQKMGQQTPPKASLEKNHRCEIRGPQKIYLSLAHHSIQLTFKSTQKLFKIYQNLLLIILRVLSTFTTSSCLSVQKKNGVFHPSFCATAPLAPDICTVTTHLKLQLPAVKPGGWCHRNDLPMVRCNATPRYGGKVSVKPSADCTAKVAPSSAKTNKNWPTYLRLFGKTQKVCLLA